MATQWVGRWVLTARSARRFPIVSRRSFMTDQPRLDALVILNANGKRVLSKHFQSGVGHDLHGSQAQEQQWFQKCSSAVRPCAPNVLTDAFPSTSSLTTSGQPSFSDDADVFIHQDHLVVFKTSADVTIMAVALAAHENELAVALVLETIYTALVGLLEEVSEMTILQNYETALLVVDEVVDDRGVILEVNPLDVQERLVSVLPRSMDLSEQSLGEALNHATTSVTRSLLR